LRSGQLAQVTGVSADSLRHYERLRLLPCPRRSAGNYRLYAPEAVARVELIQRALSVGFTLTELASILQEREQGCPPCARVRALLAAKVAHLDNHIREVTRMQAHLSRMLADWDERLARRAPGKPARLLENLPPPPAHAALPSTWNRPVKQKKGKS